jgi:hypothetical protein
MRALFNAESAVTAATGAVDISAKTAGSLVSSLPAVEAWLRILSLLVGIAVGVATFVSLVRRIKNK